MSYIFEKLRLKAIGLEGLCKALCPLCTPKVFVVYLALKAIKTNEKHRTPRLATLILPRPSHNESLQAAATTMHLLTSRSPSLEFFHQKKRILPNQLITPLFSEQNMPFVRQKTQYSQSLVRSPASRRWSRRGLRFVPTPLAPLLSPARNPVTTGYPPKKQQILSKQKRNNVFWPPYSNSSRPCPHMTAVFVNVLQICTASCSPWTAFSLQRKFTKVYVPFAALISSWVPLLV